MATYVYNLTRHHLVINGDGAKWITSCQEYFRNNATFVIDRFHVARDVQRLFRNHTRYRSIRKKISDYDWEGFMVELNSAVDTLYTGKREEGRETRRINRSIVTISQGIGRLPRKVEKQRH